MWIFDVFWARESFFIVVLLISFCLFFSLFIILFNKYPKWCPKCPILKCPKCPITVQNVRFLPNSAICPNIPNCPILYKMSKLSDFVKMSKLSKSKKCYVRFCPNCTKMFDAKITRAIILKVSILFFTGSSSNRMFRSENQRKFSWSQQIWNHHQQLF